MNNRKVMHLLIYPRFQIVLLLAHIIVSIATLLIVRFKSNEVFQRLITMGEKTNLPKEHAYFTFIENSKQMMDINLNWALAFSVFLTILSSLYLSHKVVGPIHRLRSYFKAIIDGKPQGDLKFRSGDYFQDLPDIINEGLKKKKE